MTGDRSPYFASEHGLTAAFSATLLLEEFTADNPTHIVNGGEIPAGYPLGLDTSGHYRHVDSASGDLAGVTVQPIRIPDGMTAGAISVAIVDQAMVNANYLPTDSANAPMYTAAQLQTWIDAANGIHITIRNA